MIDPWVDVASRLGIPVAILAAVFFAIWKIIQWFGVNVAVPARDRAFHFLDRLEGTVDTIGEQIHEQTKQIKAQTEKADQTTAALKQIEEKLSGVCKGNR
jgi:hypothetical protein